MVASNSETLTLAPIVNRRSLLLFYTEAKIYSEIMQSMKN